MSPISSRLSRKLLLLTALWLLGSPFLVMAEEKTPPPQDETARTIEWTDLIPVEDLDALQNAQPAADHNEQAPSLEEQISRQIEQSIDKERNQRYLEALNSTNIRPEWNNRQIRIPGFIVPLEFNDEQIVTEFFLVPYFGACIHVPPPPPNQIIHVKSAKGFQLDELYTPFWITGTLKTETIKNDLAQAAYTMTASKIEIYIE